jgi:hypothetical protein
LLLSDLFWKKCPPFPKSDLATSITTCPDSAWTVQNWALCPEKWPKTLTLGLWDVQNYFLGVLTWGQWECPEFDFRILDKSRIGRRKGGNAARDVHFWKNLHPKVKILMNYSLFLIKYVNTIANYYLAI